MVDSKGSSSGLMFSRLVLRCTFSCLLIFFCVGFVFSVFSFTFMGTCGADRLYSILRSSQRGPGIFEKTSTNDVDQIAQTEIVNDAKCDCNTSTPTTVDSEDIVASDDQVKTEEDEKIRHVFINAGWNNGKYCEMFFEQTNKYDEIVKSFDPSASLSDWEYIGFEASDRFINEARAMEEKYAPQLKVYTHTAVWINDKGISFEKGAGEGERASQGDQVKFGEEGGSTPSIDFSSWLGSNVKENDIVIMKMNIEGAEYPVLEKILMDGNCKLIDELYIRFHSTKVEMTKHMLNAAHWDRHSRSIARLFEHCGTLVDLKKLWTTPEEWKYVNDFEWQRRRGSKFVSKFVATKL